MALEENIQAFFDPSHMQWKLRTLFTLPWRDTPKTKFRRLLVVSTFNLSPEQKQDLLRRYLAAFSAQTVSFPLKERASHLMTRIDSRVFNFGRAVVNWLPRFRRKSFALPRSRVLEVVVALEANEDSRLHQYLANVLANRRRTIGKFRMEGHQYTVGKIDQNRTLRSGHNCSSWIATAPLGPQDQPLLELLGGRRKLEVGTNPGWWTSWLASCAPEERIPLVILWTPAPLEEELAREFTWDYNRH